MGKAIVKLENLSKNFGDVTAVDNINLEIEEGEFVTLLGPSGCGKTTTLRMVAGLEMPTSGLIYLESQNVTSTPPEKRPVNMVFQAYALFPHMTIAENIAFGPLIKKWPKTEIELAVEEMLRLVQLEGYGSRRPDQLSGGQAQRVALARALVNRPRVLLLDEPLGSLDLKLRKAMQLELRNIQQRLGMTFIYVTHDQEEALVMSDRIVLMDRGRIVQAGSPTEIYNRPSSEFVSRFIGETNLLQGRITAINPEHTAIDANGLVLLTPVVANLTPGQEVVVSIRPERANLFLREEDIPKNLPNVFSGTIESAIFLGPIARYHVRLPNDQIFVVEEATVDGALNYGANTSLCVGWEIKSNIVLLA